MTLSKCHWWDTAFSSILMALLFGTLILSSCQQSEKTDPADDFYDKTIQNANGRYGFYYDAKSFNYIDSSYKQAKNLSVMERFKFYGFFCGYYYQVKKDYIKAMSYADSMALTIENSGNQNIMVKQYAEANYSKGDVYFAAGNYEDAYKYYFKTKIIAKGLDDCIASEYNYRLGMVLYKQKRFKSAAHNFKLAFVESNDCKSDFATFWRRQELLNNAALSYAKAGMLDSASSYFNQALYFINDHEPKYKSNAIAFRISKGVLYGNLGDVYQQQGDSATAEKLYKDAIWNNSGRLTELSDGQLTRIKLAQLYKAQNKIELFRQTLDDVKGGMDSVENADVEMSWNELMSSYYYLLNQQDKAYEHLRIYHNLKDSAQSRNQILLSGDANAQLLSLEKQYEIDILKKNGQLQSLYLAIVLLFAIMILAIASIVYYNWRKSKHRIRELDQLNEQVKDQKETLEKTLERLEQSIKEKDRILRIVAHDLRNPLGGIASVSGLMLDDDNSPEQMEMLSLIQNTSNDSLILINEILEAADGHQLDQMKKQWVDLNALIANSADLLQFKALEKNQFIITNLPDQNDEIFINREKMGRVLSNLLSNAIKFSPADANILIGASIQHEKILISVKDNGIGIPDSIKEKIFDMFTSAKRLGTSGEKPFGLGLAISKQIVNAHNGKLWFENNSESGTTFYVELPMEKRERTPN